LKTFLESLFMQPVTIMGYFKRDSFRHCVSFIINIKTVDFQRVILEIKKPLAHNFLYKYLFCAKICRICQRIVKSFKSRQENKPVNACMCCKQVIGRHLYSTNCFICNWIIRKFRLTGKLTKMKLILEQAMKAQRRSRDIPLLFL